MASPKMLLLLLSMTCLALTLAKDVAQQNDSQRPGDGQIADQKKDSIVNSLDKQQNKGRNSGGTKNNAANLNKNQQKPQKQQVHDSSDISKDSQVLQNQPDSQRIQGGQSGKTRPEVQNVKDLKGAKKNVKQQK